MTQDVLANISKLYDDYNDLKSTPAGYGLGALGFPGYIALLADKGCNTEEIEKKVNKLEEENETLKKQIQELQKKKEPKTKKADKAGTKKKPTRKKVLDKMDKK